MREAKQKIYLETSVISAYFDFWGKAPSQKSMTRKFLNLVKNNFELYVSEVVIAELEQADSQIKKKLIKFIEPMRRLKIDQPTIILLEKYIKANIVPASKKADATHLAVAVVNKIDYIVSWNNRHLTRPFKRKQINEFNQQHKLYLSLIVTPVDFIDKL